MAMLVLEETGLKENMESRESERKMRKGRE